MTHTHRTATKRYIFILLLTSVALFSSCRKDFSVWRTHNEAWLDKNKTIIDSLSKAETKTDYESAGITPSGIQYVIRHRGYGVTAKRSSAVTVTYENFLIDGTAVGHAEKFSVEIKDMVEGWQEILCSNLVKQGANFTIYIPWNLAYGKTGNKVASSARFFVPPYSTLICHIEILKIVNILPK
ncbi:MAG: FKBP-type peptidyl-prolyl cis-trans isomerase [Bacteroidetes bacterium]|nr:FKBP-type peptidyl-prolyl cis-trans isomerase [Bacteroidota bacterium]